jgi:glutaredoxin 3
MSSIVRVFTTTYCGYCVAAKRLLSARGIDFAEVDVTGDHEQRMWLVQQSGQRTVPQIFIGDEPIGGYNELAALDRAGRLQPKVDAAQAGAG